MRAVKDKVSRSAKERRRDRWLVVLPIVSILMPILLWSAFLGWCWSGLSMDGYAATGADRWVLGAWIFFLAVCSIATKFWFFSIPFCLVAALALRRFFTTKHHDREQHINGSGG
jgi:hypothetical protein